MTKKWQLKYRATRDGFGADSFHRKCDGIPNTLTVIKSEHGNIFGGFVEKAWSSSDKSVVDPKAFIFSLVNKDKKQFKTMCSYSGKAAMNCLSFYGPTFGGGSDIQIASNSNVNRKSYSNFGYSYKHVNYQRGKAEALTVLAGSHKFKTVEIEVFTI